MKQSQEQTPLANTFDVVVNSKKIANYGKERVALALGNYQGQRLILQIIIYASEIPNLFKYASRPINESQVSEIKNYILSRSSADKKWILGALTATVNPDSIKWEFIGANLYIVSIPNSTPIHITDGQHRIGAINELMASEYRESIANEQIPLSLILNKRSRQADVDFRDMAQGITIPNSMLIAFASEGRDAIAIELISRVNFFRDSTRMNSPSPGSGSKYIYTSNYIAGLVGCAMRGDSNASLAEYDSMEKIEQAAQELSEILNQFFSLCPATANLCTKEKLTNNEVSTFRSDYILGLSVGLEILGHLIYQLGKENITISEIATKIDWSRNNDVWNATIKNKITKNSMALTSEIIQKISNN